MQLQQLAKSAVLVYNQLPKAHRMMLGMLTAATLCVAVWHPFAVYHERNADNEQYIETDFAPPADTSGTQAGTGTDTDTDTDDIITDSSDQLPDEGLAKESDDIDEASPTDTVIPTSLEYTVASGDSLSAILTQYGIDSSDVALLSNQYKGLRNLQIGQTLAWELNDDGELKSLSWAVNRRETRTYVRSGNGFKETKEMREGEWQTKRLTGKVSGSLNASASKAGLTRSEVRDISKALQWQVDVRKVKNGDRFTVLTSREMLDGKQEQSQMLAVRLHTNGRDYYAFRAEDGRFYDAKGDGLERGFLRFPTARQFRVSSHFNPRRVNPVTGRVAPHKGVDFAMPVGTPVLAVGDGEVVVAKFSGAAGNFVAIRHGRQFTTRYMHMRKLLVKPGQKVKRGDKVGLSGNTGRSTGPHLHFEVWNGQQAVNPLTAKLPRSGGLTGKDRTGYLALVKQYRPQLTLD